MGAMPVSAVPVNGWNGGNMDYTYYLFAFFIFVLVCATIYLSSVLRKSHKEEAAKPQPPDDFREREEELVALFHRMERAIANMQEEMEEAREQVRIDHEEAASMLETMRHLASGMRSEQQQAEAPPQKRGRGRPRSIHTAEPAGRAAAELERRKPGPKKKTLGDKVRELSDAGATPERIAQELSISRGEVDLALGIRQEKSI